MYRYQYDLVKEEVIYIAGPECFYTRGFEMLNAMRRYAESKGFQVTLPNDNKLDLENPDLQKRADSIMADLAEDMNHTTVIISDLEMYRGSEADSGTVFEIGMAYAKGARCYGYTRDKRSLAAKSQGAMLKDGILYDEDGRKMPYPELPFSPDIIGSTKIIEGDFYACLNTLAVDLEEEQKSKAVGKPVGKTVNYAESKPVTEQKHPLIFLSGFERYEANGFETLEKMKKLCMLYGFHAVSPLDTAGYGEIMQAENDYLKAACLFQNIQHHVRNCDIVIANLNNYRGYEVNNDVAFECGMGYQLGKKLYGYMDDTRPLIEKIPHLGEQKEYRDHTGSNVENFNYPVNLMFSCNMKIFMGKFEEIIAQAAKDYINMEV